LLSVCEDAVDIGVFVCYSTGFLVVVGLSHRCFATSNSRFTCDADGKGRASSDEFVGLLSAFKKMSGGGLQTPRRTRKISQTQEYCSNNRDYYLSYCMGMLVDRDEATRDFLFRFCPWYENKCLHNDR
ncbi:hypothetical protein COOONC_17034, partial [Cooperia oncophora]